MSKFRKKPVVIEAVQWTGDNLKEVIAFTGLHPSAKKWSWEEYEQVVKTEGLKIFTLEGKMNADVNDWIIKGVQGEFYPCKPDIFEKTYEDAKNTRSIDVAEIEAVIEETEVYCPECDRKIFLIDVKDLALKIMNKLGGGK